MQKKIRFGLVAMVSAVLLGSCGGEEATTPVQTKENPTMPEIQVPAFNADSAYQYIENQLAFGPRVPNTPEHDLCAEYLKGFFEQQGWKTMVQEGEAKAFNGVSLKMKNIIAQWAPENRTRIVFFAHWDSRPFADRDTKDRSKPILAANDGGSGVAVLMEMARLIQSETVKPNVGVDIVLFDAEDYGQPAGSMGTGGANTWCLGSQYWSKNQPIPGYTAKFGVLLDMVGGYNATFPMEGHSLYFAPEVVNKVWSIAARLGYGNYFVQKREFNGITDDHLFVNTLAKIPTIDIIHYEVDRADFGEFHHTHRDDLSVIDKNTLMAVGHTLLYLVYTEKQ